MIDLRIGDCIELAEELDDDSIDCTVTSPPYFMIRLKKVVLYSITTRLGT